MASFITINGLECPYPQRGLELMTMTLVDAARNANGVTVGQRIGREQYKLNDLVWPALTATQWSAILREFAKDFYVYVKFPDMVNNGWKTLKMYPGDRSAQPYWVDDEGKPTLYIECRVNIIDCGE